MSKRGTWVVNPRSWHYRLYRTWQDYGGHNKENYQENLCHYWRVVILWAFVRWFLRRKYFGQVWLLPITMFAAILFVMAGAVSFWLFPAKSTVTLLGAGLAVGSIYSLARLLEWVSADDERQERWSKGLLWTLVVVTFPIWIIPYLIYRACVSNPGRRLGAWFQRFGRKHENHLAIAGALLLVLLAVVLVVGMWVSLLLDHGLIVIPWTVAGLVGVGLLVSLVWAWSERIWPVIQRRKRERLPKPDKTHQLAWGYVMAKKHRICPFVEIGSE